MQSDLDLKLDLTISEPNKSDEFLFFGDLFDFVVDSSLNMFVADWQLKKVWAFDEKGNLITVIGNGGKGPGEFTNISSLVLTEKDKLAVLDFSLLRVSFFDISHNYTFANAKNLEKKEGKTEYGALPNRLYSSGSSNNVFIEYAVSFSLGTSNFKREKSIYVLDNGKLSSEPVLTVPEDEYLVVEKDGGIRVGSMPFGRKSIIRIVGDKIYYGRSDRLEIYIYNQGGFKVGQIQYSYDPVEITDDDISQKELSDFYLQNADQLPKIWPSFDWFVVDDENRIWIAVNTEDREKYSLWVFDRQGNFLNSTKISKSVELKSIQDSFAFGLKKNEDESQTIVRYKVIGINE